ncbi:MAG: dolichyl-phosphate-mannose--protein mannosyltransferase [Desulfamplus sp.]|nr:dolichyl-phosphate-mannose--protein mannosyltransferase [Desulfamplus sp.]
MIVVAIIGILAAIAIPNFINYQCKAKQAEAKSGLGTIRSMQEAYFAEYDAYADSMDKIGFASKGTARYDFTTDGTTNTATSTGNGIKTGAADDIWNMVQISGALTNDTNACVGSD